MSLLSNFWKTVNKLLSKYTCSYLKKWRSLRKRHWLHEYSKYGKPVIFMPYKIRVLEFLMNNDLAKSEFAVRMKTFGLKIG